MPNIVFASNNISHFPTAKSGNVAGSFDSSRVPYSIAAELGEILNSPVFVPVVGEVTWCHFRTWFNSGTMQYTSTPFFRAFDLTNKLLFEIVNINNRDSIFDIKVYNGNAPVTVRSNIPMTGGKVNFIDIKYTATSLMVQVEFYVNGALAGTSTQNSNPNNYAQPCRFSFGHTLYTTFSNPQHYSEFIIADEDTRNARLNLLRPAAAGAYEEWLGSLSVLSDDDTTTGMTTVAPDKRQTVSLSAYTGAANISNFVTISSTTRGKNSPTKLQHSVRLSAVDYDGPVHNVPFQLAYQITDYKINPATSLPWTAADISAIETGFVSRA